MKDQLEKISLLSLSLMMISPFSVAPALPQMMAEYNAKGYSASQVTILFSLSSFAILAMLFLNPIISPYLTERKIISSGLLLIALGGGLPLVTQAYPLVFTSRLLLGAGIGLINAKVINIISERYQGKEKVRLLGYRSSAEVLGSSVFTFLAGFLVTLGWSKSFAIYLFALLILALYLLFVPQLKEDKQKPRATQMDKKSFNSKDRLMIIGMAVYAGFVILINTSNTLRIPLVIEKMQLGSPKEASLILSLMMLMGILSGMTFSRLLDIFKAFLLPIVAISLGLGMLVLWAADNLILVGLGALVTGFIYSVGVTVVFNQLSEKIPTQELTKATTYVLIGCNLGGGGAAIVLDLFSHFHHSITLPYLVYALLSLTLGVIMLIWIKGKIKLSVTFKKKRKS